MESQKLKAPVFNNTKFVCSLGGSEVLTMTCKSLVFFFFILTQNRSDFFFYAVKPGISLLVLLFSPTFPPHVSIKTFLVIFDVFCCVFFIFYACVCSALFFSFLLLQVAIPTCALCWLREAWLLRLMYNKKGKKRKKERKLMSTCLSESLVSHSRQHL